MRMLKERKFRRRVNGKHDRVELFCAFIVDEPFLLEKKRCQRFRIVRKLIRQRRFTGRISQ